MAKVTSEELHDVSCSGREDDVIKMQETLIKNPEKLNTPQCIYLRQQNPVVRKDVKHPPLYDAVCACHIKCVQFLIETAGASINAREYLLIKALYESDMNEDARIEMLEYLLKKGAVVNIPRYFDSNDSPLNIAIKKNLLADLDLLIKFGAISEEFDPERKHLKLLREAFKSLNIDVVKLFVLHGVQLNFEPVFGKLYSYSLIVRHPILHETFITSLNVYVGIKDKDAKVNFIRKFMRVIEFYRATGGNMWCTLMLSSGSNFSRVENVERAGENFLEYLELQHSSSFTASVKSEFRALIRNPMSLQFLVRQSIYKCLGNNYATKVATLDMPDDIMAFLNFKDF